MVDRECSRVPFLSNLLHLSTIMVLVPKVTCLSTFSSGPERFIPLRPLLVLNEELQISVIGRWHFNFIVLLICFLLVIHDMNSIILYSNTNSKKFKMSESMSSSSTNVPKCVASPSSPLIGVTWGTWFWDQHQVPWLYSRDGHFKQK